MSPLLWLVGLPLIGAVACLPFGERFAKIIAIITTLAGAVIAGVIYFSPNSPADYAVVLPLLSRWNINFALGLDGLSLPLVFLSKFMMPIAILASWHEERRARAFMILLLLLDTAMVGSFLATDIFVFYVFWEMVLIPMTLLIGIWGSHERIYASIKFFLYTFAGSIFMLVAILFLFTQYHAQFGTYASDITLLRKVTLNSQPFFLNFSVVDLLFWGFTVAFAVKIPLFPFHTWLPDAHTQAPTGGSILLAAVLLKMGTYGLLRFSIPFAPAAFERFAPILAWLAIIGILYGAWVAFQQQDMKRLIAYSSVSHLGFIVLGICSRTAEGLTGAILQMVNHGLSTGGLFLCVGILYDRRHTRLLSDFGGLAKVMPWFTFWLIFVVCSSMAVPGLNGFVGEFLILLGTFSARPLWAGIASTGVVFGAIYLLWMVRQCSFGEIRSNENQKLQDLRPSEWAAFISLAIAIILLGIAPGFFMAKFQSTSSARTYAHASLLHRN